MICRKYIKISLIEKKRLRFVGSFDSTKKERVALNLFK
jgi:hypothetical protein